MHTAHQHSESFQMPSALLSAIRPNLCNPQQQFIISLHSQASTCRKLILALPCFIALNCTWCFSEQFLSSIFQLRADSVAPHFFPGCPLPGLDHLPASHWLFQTQLPLLGSWLQQGQQLVTTNPSLSGPWFSLCRTVVLSWLFQPFFCSCVMLIIMLKSHYLAPSFSLSFNKLQFLLVFLSAS